MGDDQVRGLGGPLHDEAQLLADMARELQAAPLMALTLRPETAFALAGVVQLALRHPDLAGTPRSTAETFLAGVREYFASAPAVLEALRRGDDRAHDR